MPSTNPDLTPIFKLPSPTPPDPPDVPGDVKALADATEAALRKNVPRHPFSGPREMEWGLLTVNTPTTAKFVAASVTFAGTFATPPVLVVSSGDSRVNASATGTNPNGAQLSLRALDGADLPGGTTSVHWVALGVPA